MDYTDNNTVEEVKDTGNELFERWKNGEDISQIESIPDSDEVKDDIENEVAAEPPAEEAEEETEEMTGEETEDSNDLSEEPYRVYKTQEEFQDHIDKIISGRFKKHYDTEAEYKRLVAEMLDVSEDKAFDELIRLANEKAANEKGVDPSTYGELQKLKAQNEKYEAEKAKIDFNNTINTQLADMVKKYPSFNMDAASDNPQFRGALISFYQNPQLKNTAVEAAYKAVFFDDILKSNNLDTVVKVTKGVKAKQGRISEGAAQSNASSVTPKVDINKMSSSDFNSLVERVIRGEKIEI